MRILFECTCLIPLGMYILLMKTHLRIVYLDAGIYLDNDMIKLFYVVFWTGWLSCPIKKAACNGTYIELLFNLIPVEFLLGLYFAQYHPIITLLLMILLVVSEAMLFVRKECETFLENKRRQKKITYLYYRLALWVAFAIWIVPALITIIDYAPIYWIDSMLEQESILKNYGICIKK